MRNETMFRHPIQPYRIKGKVITTTVVVFCFFFFAMRVMQVTMTGI